MEIRKIFKRIMEIKIIMAKMRKKLKEDKELI